MNRELVAKEILKVAKLLTSTEFGSQESLNKYLQKHPGADKSKHSVKEDMPHDKRITDKDVEKIRGNANMSHSTLGPEHPRTKKLQKHLGNLIEHKKKQDKAIGQHNMSVSTMGREHPHTQNLRKEVKKTLQEAPEKTIEL